MCFFSPAGSAQVDFYEYSELENHLNNTFPSVTTTAGTFALKHTVMPNLISPNSFLPYDIRISTDWNPLELSPYDLSSYSTKYTDEQKQGIIKNLADFQRKIFESATEKYPGKNIQGGFYHSYYKYPHLKVDLQVTQFLTWVNYNASGNSISNADFRWDPSIDDYNFVSAATNEVSPKHPAMAALESISDADSTVKKETEETQKRESKVPSSKKKTYCIPKLKSKLYSKASAESSVLMAVRSDAPLEVLAKTKNGKYYKVKVAGVVDIIGYIRKSDITELISK